MKIPGHRSLAHSIALALAIKAALLYGLWHAFFAHPPTKKMRLPTAQVEQHLLAAPAPIPDKEVKDGTRR